MASRDTVPDHTVPVTTLPPEDRYFAYQSKVNGDWCPTEEVIREAQRDGGEYRLETEGPHPVPGLRMNRSDGEQIDYAKLSQVAA